MPLQVALCVLSIHTSIHHATLGQHSHAHTATRHSDTKGPKAPGLFLLGLGSTLGPFASPDIAFYLTDNLMLSLFCWTPPQGWTCSSQGPAICCVSFRTPMWTSKCPLASLDGKASIRVWYLYEQILLSEIVVEKVILTPPVVPAARPLHLRDTSPAKSSGLVNGVAAHDTAWVRREG